MVIMRLMKKYHLSSLGKIIVAMATTTTTTTTTAPYDDDNFDGDSNILFQIKSKISQFL